MIRYLAKALRAHVRYARSLYLLAVFGVALGVGAVLAIQILNASALAAFRGSVDAVSGNADLSVVGRTPTIPDSLYARVLADSAVRHAWPILHVQATLADSSDVFVDVYGTDLYASGGVPGMRPGGRARSSAQGSAVADAVASGRVLAVPGWCAIAPTLAQRLGVAVGDTFAVTSGTTRATLTVGAIVDFTKVTPTAGQRVIAMDIAQVQSLFGPHTGVTQIDLMVRPGADVSAVASRLSRSLGAGVDVLTPEQRQRRAEGLLSAFRLNLTALSFISLFVGLFLVYSAMQAALVRRRGEFGLLRSLGATRSQVFSAIAAEVALLGALGVVIGLPIGYWVAHANVRQVSATLTNLYLLHEIDTLTIPAWLYGLAAAIGIGGALLGALAPALEACRGDTKTLLAPYTLHARLRSRAGPLFAGGVLLLAAAGVWYWMLARAWRPAGFVLAVALVAAVPLLTPLVVHGVAARARLRAFGLAYSVRSLGVRLQTTSVAVAALGVAVAMLVGITLMIGSFRATLDVWVNSSLRADVYITTPSWRGTGTAAAFDSSVADRLARLPGVIAVDRLRGFPGYVGDRRVSLAGVETGIPGGERRFPLVHGDPVHAFARLRAGDAVLISEPLSRKAGLGVGDSLPLYTARGLERLPIAGVYYDYSSENGTVIMDLRTMSAMFGPGPINSMALYLAPGRDAERMVDQVKRDFANTPLVVRSNRTLRHQVFTVFNQTFAVTRILQVMGLIIAVGGITLTLLVLARERVPELALYRALGATKRQVFRIFVGEGVGIGTLGLVLGGAGGVALAGILIYVINRAYFGWTIQVAIPGRALIGQAVTILIAAVLASVYPALKASRVGAAELAREDV